MKVKNDVWAERSSQRVLFWIASREIELTEAEALDAIGVDNLIDYPGTLDDALNAMRAYAARKSGILPVETRL